MKVTKEALIKGLAETEAAGLKVTADLRSANERDTQLRQRFSKVLRQTQATPLNEYALSRLPDAILTWEEIFCEVGKLLMCNYSETWRRNVDDSIESLRHEIATIRQQ